MDDCASLLVQYINIDKDIAKIARSNKYIAVFILLIFFKEISPKHIISYYNTFSLENCLNGVNFSSILFLSVFAIWVNANII